MTSPDSAAAAPIDCHTAVQRLWDYLDGRLAPMARDEVEAHLAVCLVCPPHFAFARTMQQALAASAPPVAADADEDVRLQDARLRERVRRVLRG